MGNFVIRNSDILFGRTVATYKFAGKEAIRDAIHEVSSLKALGIDKRVAQVMYERGHLTEDKVYAVMESLLQSRQIRKVPTLQTYLFTPEDETRFYDCLGLSRDFGQTDTLRLPPSSLKKDLPLSPENLLLCVNIKQSLAKAGIHVSLLTIIHDKGLLQARFQKIIPSLTEKRRLFFSPHKRDERQIRKSTAMLFSQIAIVNAKMNAGQFQESFVAWEKVHDLGLDLKYSEVLFYMGYLDRESLEKIASFLATISEIDQRPRFPLFRLSSQEHHYFGKLREAKILRSDLLKRAEIAVENLQREGLSGIGLPEVLILQGHLTRKQIVQRWEEIRKRENDEKVRQLQMVKTEESLVQLTHQLDEDMLASKEVLKSAEAEIDGYYRSAGKAGNLPEETEAGHFEEELDHTFRTSQEQQKEAVKKEVEDLKKRLGKVDRQEAKTLNTVIGHYQRTHRTLQFYLTVTAVALFMMFLGFFFAGRHKFLGTGEKHVAASTPSDARGNVSGEKTSGPEPVRPVDKLPKEDPKPDTSGGPDRRVEPPVVDHRPKESTPPVNWDELAKLEKEKSSRMREEYAREVRGNYRLYLDNWHTPDMAKYMEEMEEKRRGNLVLFQDRWYPKSEIGDWHDLVLVKERAVEGFLQPANPERKVYLLRPYYRGKAASKIRYIKAADILSFKKGFSAWERYFADCPPAEDILGQKWLSQWCRTEDIPDLTRFQLEKLLSLAPNFPYARHALGYVWHKGDWRQQASAAKEFISFHGMWMNEEEAMRAGLTRRGSEWDFREEAALAAEMPDTSPDNIAGAQKIGENLWKAKYAFADSEDLSRWSCGKSSAIPVAVHRETLQVKTRGGSGFAYLRIPWEGDLSLKFRVWLPEKSKNVLVGLYQGDEGSGYLLRLNWQGPGEALSHSLCLEENPRVLARSGKSLISPRKWTEVAVHVAGPKIEVFAAKDLLFSAEDKTFRSGIVALGAMDSQVVYDDVEIEGRPGELPRNSPKKIPENLEAVAQLSPSVRSAWNQGRIHLLAGNYPAARECLDLVADAGAHLPVVWVDKGRLCLEIGDDQGAYDNFTRAIDLDPGMSDAYLGRGKLLQKRREYERAMNDFLKALSLTPEDILVYYALVQLYFEQGNERDALAVAQKAGEKVADKNTWEKLLKETRILLRQNQPSAAKAQSERYAVSGDVPEIYAQAACAWLEAIYAHYTTIYGNLPGEGKWRILLFSRREDLCRYIRLEYPQAKHDMIGLWWPVTGEVLAAIDQHPVLWRQALFGGAVGQMSAHERNLPPWLKDGTLAYFAWSVCEGGEIYWDRSPPYWTRRLKSGDTLPLTGLSLMSYENYYTQDWFCTNRLSSYAWIHFLIHADGGRYRPLLKRYVEKIRAGESWNTAAGVFSDDTLTKAYRTYWDNIRPN